VSPGAPRRARLVSSPKRISETFDNGPSARRWTGEKLGDGFIDYSTDWELEATAKIAELHIGSSRYRYMRSIYVFLFNDMECSWWKKKVFFQYRSTP